MDKKYLRKKHRELWTWLSKNPTKNKKEWPGWNEVKEELGLTSKELIDNAYCFACMACNRICSKCPCAWEDKNGNEALDCTDGEFMIWSTCKGDDELRKPFALAIRNSWR